MSADVFGLTDQAKSEPARPPTDHMSTMTPYTEYLIRIATEQATNSMEIDPPVGADPVAFVREILQELNGAIAAGTTTTRLGIEHMIDTLFANPDLAPLLDSPHNRQHDCMLSLNETTPLFQSYWTHIICPAWNQHADVRRACLESADTRFPQRGPDHC